MKLDYLLMTALSIDVRMPNQPDTELLQEDINAIQTWASTWQMNEF